MVEILSIACIQVDEGKDQETLQTLSELYTLMARKGYSRDLLYRDTKEPGRLINLRYWKSEEARDEAHEDPDVHRLWQRLSQTSSVESVIEKLETIEGSWPAGAR
jgi:quinol monooxygenase YgiN